MNIPIMVEFATQFRTIVIHFLYTSVKLQRKILQKNFNAQSNYYVMKYDIQCFFKYQSKNIVTDVIINFCYTQVQLL